MVRLEQRETGAMESSASSAAGLDSSGGCGLDDLPGSYHLNPQARPGSFSTAALTEAPCGSGRSSYPKPGAACPGTPSPTAAEDPVSPWRTGSTGPGLPKGTHQVRGASRLIAIPVTLAGLPGPGVPRLADRPACPACSRRRAPKSVAVDLRTTRRRRMSRLPVAALPPAAGGRPAGAIEKPDAPPPPLPANPECVPEQTPDGAAQPGSLGRRRSPARPRQGTWADRQQGRAAVRVPAVRGRGQGRPAGRGIRLQPGGGAATSPSSISAPGPAGGDPGHREGGDPGGPGWHPHLRQGLRRAASCSVPPRKPTP